MNETSDQIDDILRWFHSDHLPPSCAKDVSQLCGQLAVTLAEGLTDSNELKLGLHDLLRAKDSFVRAAILSEGTEDSAKSQLGR